MSNNKICEINLAVQSFSDWQHPWKFSSHVINSLTSKEASEIFHNIMNKANNLSCWKRQELCKACSEAEQDLIALFPNVDLNTIKLIIRAISYEWK